MPSESSSVVCNATNGIEPPRDFLSIKKSKKGTLKQIVPGFPRLKSNYTLLWDMPDMTGYLNVMAVIQKFFDQSISTNTSYNPQNYEGKEVRLCLLNISQVHQLIQDPLLSQHMVKANLQSKRNLDFLLRKC